MRAVKVVQTEVDPELYRALKKTAEAKGLSLKEAVRRALRDWVAREGDLSWDALFDLRKTFTVGKATNASEVDEVVYGRKRR